MLKSFKYDPYVATSCFLRVFAPLLPLSASGRLFLCSLNRALGIKKMSSNLADNNFINFSRNSGDGLKQYFFRSFNIDKYPLDTPRILAASSCDIFFLAINSSKAFFFKYTVIVSAPLCFCIKVSLHDVTRFVKHFSSLFLDFFSHSVYNKNTI